MNSHSNTALYQALGQITNIRYDHSFYHSLIHVVFKHSLSTYYVSYTVALGFTIYS